MSVTASFGQYLENAILNWFRGTAFPAVPTTMQLALFTTPPANGTDVGAVEVAGNGYARATVTPAPAAWSAPLGAAPAQIGLGANAVFPTPTGAWGVITGWGLYDVSNNLLAYGTFAAIQPTTGDAVEFLSGNLTISVQ